MNDLVLATSLVTDKWISLTDINFSIFDSICSTGRVCLHVKLKSILSILHWLVSLLDKSEKWGGDLINSKLIEWPICIHY